jgi:phenylalanyl-tRNA synthetase beta chain
VTSFPSVRQDVAVDLPDGVAAAELLAVVRDAGGALLHHAEVFDVYTGAQVGDGRKSLAFSLRLRADDRTLTAQEAAAVREAVVAEAHRRFGATLRA